MEILGSVKRLSIEEWEYCTYDCVHSKRVQMLLWAQVFSSAVLYIALPPSVLSTLEAVSHHGYCVRTRHNYHNPMPSNLY